MHDKNNLENVMKLALSRALTTRNLAEFIKQQNTEIGRNQVIKFFLTSTSKEPVQANFPLVKLEVRFYHILYQSPIFTNTDIVQDNRIYYQVK